jgi:hypothetical protein
MANLAKHILARHVADDAVSATPIRVYAVMLVAGADAASRAELTNDANGEGTNVIEVAAPVSGNTFVNFADLGPVEFSSKCYLDITGAGAVFYVWYD